ncbi:MAG: hypothetical protein ACOH2N_04720 [Devosia sp.]
MTLPETLPASSFANLLKIEDVQFIQTFQQQRSATGGGETRYADRAPALYKVDLTTIHMLNAEAEGIMSLINSRAGGLKAVLLYNYRLPFPASDPDGAIIGATVPTINVITDRLHVSFSGFPPGYVIPLGTYFGIVFDDLYYLGQFVEARTANPVTGAVAATEIWPPLPASITGTPDVIIAKPCAKFRIVPGSAYPAKIDAQHSTIKLSLEQTYR